MEILLQAYTSNQEICISNYVFRRVEQELRDILNLVYYAAKIPDLIKFKTSQLFPRYQNWQSKLSCLVSVL